jgi:hypothetical protein
VACRTRGGPSGGRRSSCIRRFCPSAHTSKEKVLTVQDRHEVRRFDLATASKIALRSVPPLISWSFLVLHAYQEAGSRPVRLVLEGPDWSF